MDRTQQALDFITTCCRYVGAFQGTSDVSRYLEKTALEMAVSKPSVVFPDQYIEHVAYAVDMIASNIFLSPPAAIASVYLATRFEFYFRILYGKLNGDGTWISPSAKQAARAVINDNRLRGSRISSVALAYKIMKLGQSRKIVQACTALDNSFKQHRVRDLSRGLSVELLLDCWSDLNTEAARGVDGVTWQA